MPISLKGRFWRFFLKNALKGRHLSIADYRAQSALTARLLGKIPESIKIDRLEIDSMHAVWVHPVNANQEKVMIHMHGGGYVTGSADASLLMCVPLAQTIQINILVPDYRLAPEHPFPAALQDALKSYNWLLSKGFQPENITISGDSAGGGLGIAMVLSLRDSGAPLPARIICFSPWTDLANQNQSHNTRAKAEVILSTLVLQEWANAYVGKDDFKNPLVSPINADFHGLPPLFIQVGSDEILLDDARLLSAKAQADGVQVDLNIWDGMWHDWQVLGSLIPEAELAFKQLIPFFHK